MVLKLRSESNCSPVVGVPGADGVVDPEENPRWLGAVQDWRWMSNGGPGLPEDVKKKPLDGVGRTVWRSRGAGVSRTMLSVVVGKGLLFLVSSWYISAPKGARAGVI